MTEESSKKNVAIMYIRTMAMLFIFTDHAVAYTDIPLKSIIIQITNSGNLIFLFISGFLYGGKTINNFKIWINKRIVKLWISYFTFLLIYFSVALILGNGGAIVKPFIIYTFVLQGFLGTNGGPGWLWFMTLLLLCYCMIPILQKVRKYTDTFTGPKYILGIIVIVVMLQSILAYYCNLTLDFGHPLSWYLVAFFVFALGYFSNRKIINFGISKQHIFIGTIIMCIAMLIRVVGQWVIDGSILYDRIISIWTNVILDVWIICIVYYIVDTNKKYFDFALVRQGDKISYAFYLVHAFSLEICARANLETVLFIIISFALSIVFAYFLNLFSNRFIHHIENRK